MNNRNWLPRRREMILAMGKNWNVNMAAKADPWGIPEDIRVRLSAAIDIAERELAIPPNERNAVTNTRLKTAFDELTAAMRDIKKRYFYNPPLTDSDIVALGLKLKDSEPTPVADPVGLAKASVKYPNKGALELHLEHDGSTPADAKANYGFRIYHGVVAAGETLPASGMDLHESIFSRKKKVLFTYNPDDSGKTAYFCIRYENSKGKAGQWGAMFSAIIP